MKRNLLLVVAVTICVTAFNSCGKKSGSVLDEAKSVNRVESSFPAADEDYFHDMDRNAAGPVTLSPDEIKGRNTWIVWSGGNDRFWDLMSKSSVGTLDFVKTLSSYPTAKPALKYSRANRWKYLGLVNEPCFVQATGPDPDRWGLWLDKRVTGPNCPPDPFENEQKYPGVKIGSRGTKLGDKDFPVGSYYGYATGIVGLRLFPNPDFDEKAAKNWDAKRYYEDPSYYESKGLVKPYRVGMTCAFCHVGPNPIHPPQDPENPAWADLSSNVGAQYFWVDRIFAWQADEKSFPYQLFHTSRPGTLDTSLVSTDYINNPRTMNAVYALPARMALAARWGKETLSGGSKNNKQFNDFLPADNPLSKFYQAPDTSWTPRVLKDGSDSVGALGALNRVYLNIGLFSEEWLTHFQALTGGKPISPIEIAVARQNSSYWLATEQQTMATAQFFLKTTEPHLLKDAPGGAAYLSKDKAVLDRGKTVFAERCARCHSSKIPEPAPGVDPGGCSGKDYLNCWNQYWSWTKTDDFKSKMRKIVMQDDFLKDNTLSTELRIPLPLLQTNACSPLATNAIAGNIWDNFSSQTYKDLPSVGSVTIYNPMTGAPESYEIPGGGRGFTRPPSLISLWSTSPFLQNNSVGHFEWSPSVDARMRSFQDSIEQMLWPEKREKDALLGDKVPGKIDRTTARSWLFVPYGYLPVPLEKLKSPGERWLPQFFGDGAVHIGPIPAGTPVGLLSNIDILGESTGGNTPEHQKRVLELLLKAKVDLATLPADASDDEVKAKFANLAEPMWALSKCKDLVVNRGHYFGTDMFKEEPGLSDSDKRALIEYLKTF